MRNASLCASRFFQILLVLVSLSSVKTVTSAEIPDASALVDRFATASQTDQTVLQQAGRQLASIVARTTRAVVNIESRHESQSGETEETGSGVIVSSPRSKDVFVVTNHHVVANASLNHIEILLFDGRVIYPIEKLIDPDSDLAILRITDPNIEPAQFGDSDNLDIGHFVLAMGSPFGLSQSVTLGIISAKGRRALELPGRRVVNQDFLQTDAAINPGNSGGPLIDLDGRVVGINTAIASQGGGNEGIGFSIPSTLVQFVASQLLEYGRVRRGYLGVELDENYDIDAARRYSLDRKYGARVTKVIDRTPAAEAGLLIDDIILDFDGIEVEDENDLINRVSLTPVNKRVRMIVLRNGKKSTLFVTLAERSQQRSALPESIPQTLPTSTDRYMSQSVLELDSSLAVQLGYAQGQRGLLVKRIVSSQGENGLQLYDVIEEVARQPVKTLEELDTKLTELSDETSVVLKVQRVQQGSPESVLVIWNRQ